MWLVLACGRPPPTGPDPCPPVLASGAPSCSLAASSPVTVTEDGAVIAGLRIDSDGEPAVLVLADGVTLQNLEIHHRDGPGIRAVGAADLLVEDVSIAAADVPASGPLPDEWNNVELFQSPRAQIRRVRVRRGSSGVYLVQSPDATVSSVDGCDLRGPFPRGQLVQFDESDRSVLEDFSAVNGAGSWPEDNVNVYRSVDVTVRRGLLDGNNSPSGVGVIFDGDTASGSVEDVDAVHMGNGCFSAYAGADGSTFRRTRCRDNRCDDQGRGEPLSGGLMWSGREGSVALRLEDATFAAPCAPDNVVWPEESFAVLDVTEADFEPRPAIAHQFCWE